MYPVLIGNPSYAFGPYHNLSNWGITHTVVQRIHGSFPPRKKRSVPTADQSFIAASEIKYARSYVSSRPYIL